MPARPLSPTVSPAPRRHLLRNLLLTLAASLVVAGCMVAYLMMVPPPPYTPLSGQPTSQVTLLALGDQGSGDLQQWRVARGMERVAESEGGLNMVLLLGDNFYGKPLKGTGDAAWQLKFERVYRGDWLSHVPFYAVLGNHDYPSSAAVELDYGRKGAGSGRFQMPDPFYVRDFGETEGRPLLRVVFLDTSQNAAGRQRQADFLQAAFAKDGPAPLWKMVVAHHAIRSGGGKHGEDQELLAQLLPAMQRSGVDIYLSGHEHNQQVVVHPGEPAWLISGGGGQTIDGFKPAPPTDDVPFAVAQPGFARLAFTPEQLQLAYYDADGRQEQRFLWARACPWMAQGCLHRNGLAQMATN